MEPRLDAVESVFFKRELESIDQKMYDTKYPQYLARTLIPTQDGVSEGAEVYTYSLMDRVGKAQVIGNYSDDVPAADVFGTQTPQLIKRLASAYRYNIFEIKDAARVGRPLDAMKAVAARRSLEEAIDEFLAVGSTKHGLVGMLSIASGTTSFTPSTKAAGGLTWGTLAAPNATGEEVAGDIMGICSKIVENTKGVFNRFRVLLPIEQYNYAAQVKLGPISDTTALKFALATCPYLESVTPWYRCDGAGSGATDRMMAYPYDAEVMTALVPMELQPQAPQQRNFDFVVNLAASCGGIVCRYPVAVAYGDGI